MSYRNMFEVWHYDKPKVDKHTVKAEASSKWYKVVDFPKYSMGFRIHNRGAFTVYYAYQKSPTAFEELEAGVADFKSFCPKELFLANKETTTGRDVPVYVEYWTPDDESFWPDILSVRFGEIIERIRSLLPGRR